jgi:hypothetical protein
MSSDFSRNFVARKVLSAQKRTAHSRESRLLEFALEYERSLKASKEYARIRAALECERRIGCVLYLTASPDLTVALVYQ